MDTSSADISNLRSSEEAKKREDCAEASRIDDLLLLEMHSLRDEIKSLKSQIKELDSYVSILAANQKSQGQRITKIVAKKDPGKKAHDRAERINHYMGNRPDHKASFEALRGFLQVNDVLLNSAISVLMKSYPGKFMKSHDGHDKRKRFLAEIVKF